MRYFAYSAATAWIILVLLRVLTGSFSQVAGEGKFVLIVISLPLFAVGLIHSLFLRVSDRFPIVYAATIAMQFLLLVGVYRAHFPDGNTTEANISCAATAIVIFLVCACLYYAIPATKLLLIRRHGIQ